MAYKNSYWKYYLGFWNSFISCYWDDKLNYFLTRFDHYRVSSFMFNTFIALHFVKNYQSKRYKYNFWYSREVLYVQALPFVV